MRAGRRFVLDIVKDVESGGNVSLYRLGYTFNKMALYSASAHGPQPTCRVHELKGSHGIAHRAYRSWCGVSDDRGKRAMKSLFLAMYRAFIVLIYCPTCCV